MYELLCFRKYHSEWFGSSYHTEQSHLQYRVAEEPESQTKM